MTLNQLPALITLVILLLVMYEVIGWLNQRGFLDRTPSPRPEPHVTFCVWCIYRDGDDCTNPESPVGGEECGLVCSGKAMCKLRAVRRCISSWPYRVVHRRGRYAIHEVYYDDQGEIWACSREPAYPEGESL
jgi:hypothetical protein